MECYASCPTGFEHALAGELKAIGAQQVRPLKGRVSFDADLEHIYRACLWSRLASRVNLVLGRVNAADADELYDGARSIAWETVLAPGATIAVSARGTSSALRSTAFTALRVKDAICDRMTEATGARPNVDADRPAARVGVSLRDKRASIEFDMSGEPLFKRLARGAVEGPAHILRPDYAAFALSAAGWADACGKAPDGAEAPQAPSQGADEAPILLDISCAGGGLAVEAASIARGSVPNANRNRWGFMGWAGHDERVWSAVRAEAEEQALAAAHRDDVRVAATDVQRAARGTAGSAVRVSGSMGAVRICQPNAEELLDAASQAGGNVACIAADFTETPVEQLASALALLARARKAFPQARVVCLGEVETAGRALAAEPELSCDLRMGASDVRLAVFGAAQGEKGPATVDLGEQGEVPVLVPESDQFAARLKKVARLRRKWAKREGITCYRVYDADLPDYAVAVDLYNGSAATPGRWAVVAEYRAPKTVDPNLAQARFLDVLALVPRILDVDPANVHAKARVRSKGGSQYAREKSVSVRERSGRPGDGRDARRNGVAPGKHGSGRGAGAPDRQGARAGHRKAILVEEGGLTFEVNFDDRLDTGLFLDHRITRGLVRSEMERLSAQGLRRFLNLFAYTGTATCYAADGGAEETVTVDLSNTYLDWAERNMQRNGFGDPCDYFERDDVLAWIERARRGRDRWDLVFCDPPTFSNSAKMGSRSFDVQRDHVDLLVGVSRLLSREGEAIFSCNLRTFKPDLDKLARAGVVLEDITAQTIPEDFARNPRIHKCYILTRTTPEEAQRRLTEARG